MSDILRRHKANIAECEAAAVFAQVGTLLTPAYKSMSHMSLIWSYNYGEEDAIRYVVRIFEALNPGLVLNKEVPDEKEEKLPGLDGNVHQLLLVDDDNGAAGERTVRSSSCMDKVME